MVDGANQRVRRGREERVGLDVGVRTLPSSRLYRRQVPGKAKSGRSTSPFNANQRHIAGFTSPFGSQKAPAGTGQRRCPKESRQNGLVCIWSSHVGHRLRPIGVGSYALSFMTLK
jgi:hypothetical protein